MVACFSYQKGKEYAKEFIKNGDIVEIKFGENWSKFEILRVSELVRKDDATEMYKLIFRRKIQ